MSKILFDGTSCQGTTHVFFHGGGEYAKFILKEAIRFGYQFDIVFDNTLQTDAEVQQMMSNSHGITRHEVSSKTEIYALINKEHYDCFFSALPAKYHDYPCSTPLFGVIHGLRSIELPWDFYRYKYSKNIGDKIRGWIISHCPAIQDHLKRKHITQSERLLNIPNARFIVVSEHTKHSVLFFYPNLKPENISVFHSPFSIEEVCSNQTKDNYFLMVSGNRYEKNVYRAILAFDRLFSAGWLQGKKVKITGCQNMSLWKEIRHRDRFELLPYVSTEELNLLYERAFCFVYPSLNEGFGYPPLKAMGYGTPVAASSATSIPEVCGDAACYFSPTNIDDMANRILRIDLNTSFREKLVERGYVRVHELLDKQNHDVSNLLKMIFE